MIILLYPCVCFCYGEQVAIGMLESACPRQGSRIMMFVGGPPTVGPGTIVGRDKTETIRSHPELQKV